MRICKVGILRICFFNFFSRVRFKVICLRIFISDCFNFDFGGKLVIDIFKREVFGFKIGEYILMYRGTLKGLLGKLNIRLVVW